MYKRQLWAAGVGAAAPEVGAAGVCTAAPVQAVAAPGIEYGNIQIESCYLSTLCFALFITLNLRVQVHQIRLNRCTNMLWVYSPRAMEPT